MTQDANLMVSQPLLRFAFLLVAVSARPASAQDVTGEVAIVSDYRFRGVSLSDGSPALQGGVELEQGGWQAEIWGSSRADGVAVGREIDLYIGRTGLLGGLGYEAGARVYFVDGAAPYVEATARISRGLGAVRVDAELSYAPPQARLDDNLYAAVALSASPVRALTLSWRVGVEDSAAQGAKRDWEARAAVVAHPVTLSASIVQAAGKVLTPEERAAAGVFSIEVEF